MDLILIGKIVLSLFVVWLSVFLGEKVSLKYTGLITSFPTVVALVIFFIGLEQGKTDAGIAAFSISHAIVLFNFWMLFYWVFIRLHPFLSGVISLAVFFGAAYGYYEVFESIPEIPFAYIVFCLTLGLGFIIFKQGTEYKLEIGKKDNAVLTIVKYVLTPIFVILFTWLSKVASPVWAGIFVSAPSTGLVTLMYFHYKFGRDAARKTIESFYFYTGTFVVFGLSIFLAVRHLSFSWAFVIGMLAAVFYAYFVNLKFIPHLRGLFSTK